MVKSDNKQYTNNVDSQCYAEAKGGQNYLKWGCHLIRDGL